MSITAANAHIFWITSRAAGTAALFLSSLAVGLGLTMAMKLVKGKGPDLRITHEALSLATMVAIAIHALALLGDNFLKPTLADVTIPFVSSYKEPWMAAGIIAGWAMIILGLSYYARRRIGQKRWRAMHRFTSVAWLAGLVHAIGLGTDVGLIWFVVLIGVTALPAATLLLMRVGPEPAAVTR
jgi:sulfoxide reductase heme-binding subunit YedZ